MPGIKDLREVYEKKGNAETKKYLNGKVVVTEKLDAHRLSFEVGPNGRLMFFKKNDNRPLTIIDRTISDLYEKAIHHFESLPKMVRNNIPRNMRFGFAYFPSNKPLRIDYKTVPPNGLVLTDITQRNESGKVKRVYEDVNFLNRWAGAFNVGTVPIIFEGELDKHQQDLLSRLVSSDPQVGAWFAEHVAAIFGQSYSGNHIIEGIVVKSDNGLVQLKDPAFSLFETAYEPQESRDFYDLTIIQIKTFMESFKFPEVLRGNNPEEKYIETICEAFNSYVEANNVDESMDPTYLQPKIIGSHGTLSRKFIYNNKTVQYVNRAKIYEELFKVFLSSFRKNRKPHGLLTETFTDSFNSIVEKIYENTSNKVYSFGDYQKIFENDDYEEGVDLKEVKFQSDPLKVISSIQLAFNHTTIEPKRGDTDVSILIGDFDPLNNDHMRHIEKLTEDGNKVFLCHVSRMKTGISSKVFQLDDDTVSKMLKRIAQDNPETIAGYLVIPYTSIGKIFKSARDLNYEPKKLAVEEGCGPNYMAQLYMEDKVLGGRVGASSEFEVVEFKNNLNYKVMRSLEDGNYKVFTQHTPISVHGFWDTILTKWREWAGLYPDRVQK